MRMTIHQRSETMKKYKAAVYVRLSKEDMENVRVGKVESDSISNQKQLILDFVKEKTDITVVSIREDDGYTGTDYERPAFRQMMDDIRTGKIDCVIVKDLSRFGREYINAGKYIDRLFPYYGVRLIAINDNVDTVTRNSYDDFNITVKNLMNDNYCRDISIKIRSQLQVKRKKGEFIGAHTPYGYQKSGRDKNQLVVDPYPAKVVQDIFRWKLDGMNQEGICRKLEREGILSPMEYKRSQGIPFKTSFKTKQRAEWSPLAVRRILTNPVYVGTLVQGVRTRPNHKIKKTVVNEKDDWVIIENAHEPIIRPKNFLLVQKLLDLDTRTAPGQDYVYPLAGLITCGDCHGSMIRKTINSSGKKYIYYICSTKKNYGSCSTHEISEKKLEDTVLKLLQDHISMILELDSCMKAIREAPVQQVNIYKMQDRLQAIETELDRYKRLKILAYEDYKEGVLTKDDYIDIRRQYDKRISDSQIAQEQVYKELSMYMDNNTAQQLWIREFLEHKNITSLNRSIVVECIEKISVYEDKRIEVTFSHMQDYNMLLQQVQTYHEQEEVS